MSALKDSRTMQVQTERLEQGDVITYKGQDYKVRGKAKDGLFYDVFVEILSKGQPTDCTTVLGLPRLREVTMYCNL